MNKRADELTAGQRAGLPKSDFARPSHASTTEGKQEPGSYPVPDKQHARSALGFAAMHHGKDSGVYQQIATKVRAKFPHYAQKESSMLITKEAVIRQMSIYLSYLANKVPMSDPATKIAAMNKFSQLASSLNKTQDLYAALQATYPEKTAGDRAKLALQLIKGLSHKRAAAIKVALTKGTHQGVSAHCSTSLHGAVGGITTPQTSNVKVAGEVLQDPFAV